MRLFIVSDTYYPKKNSGAIQLQSLAEALVSSKHLVTVFTTGRKYSENNINGVDVIYIKPFYYNSNHYFLRFLSEILYSLCFFVTINRYLKNNTSTANGIIWYSPSIFFGPLISRLKKNLNVKALLIIRDIFPEWAIDNGIIKNSFTKFILKGFTRLQYNQADFIGVQAQSNISASAKWIQDHNKFKLNIFYNWLTPLKPKKVSHRTIDSMGVDFNNDKVFIYAGNVGDAQDLNLFIDAALILMSRKDLIFLIIGRGKKLSIISKRVKDESITNVVIRNEVENEVIFQILPLCHAGIISLNKNHKLDNIPGKLLSYTSLGLPILGSVNKNNELLKLNKQFNYGFISDSGLASDIAKGALLLADDCAYYLAAQKNARAFFQKFFRTELAVKKVVNFFT